MKYALAMVCIAMVGCSQPVDSKNNGDTSGSPNNGAPNNGGHTNGQTGGANNGTTAPTPDGGTNEPDAGVPLGEVPDEVDAAGARFAGTLAAGQEIRLPLTVFQGDRLTMWLRKADGTDWDPSINVYRDGVAEPLVYGNPRGNEDASIPFRAGELEAGYEFWYTGTYTLSLENRGQTDGAFEFTLECRGGGCAIDSDDADLDGDPDDTDGCAYYPGSCDAPPFGGSNATLEAAIRDAHQGHRVMNYVEARVHMFAWIDNVDGVVEGVYTGAKVQTVEIPDAAVMNTEHTWPQSRSGGDPASESDLNHLFPTDSDANSQRASLHFGNVTNPAWQEGGAKMGNDSSGDTRFEPRDAHKGDAARATFYYAVIYGQNIPSYEESVLRQWHEGDPVDDAERRRNQAIFNIQGSRNPFVDFPGLAGDISDF